jgi:hypothetical protein
MPAAHIRFVQHDSGGVYRNEITIAGEGLPRIFTNFGGTAVSEGRLAVGNAPAPAHYDADFDLRKSRNRKLRMVFTVVGGSVIAGRGPDDTSHKKPLAEEFRRNTIDPLSAVTAIQAGVRRGETAFTVPVYDGERRFDTIVRVPPRDPKQPGIHLAITLKAIAGFKGGEHGDPDNAPRPVSLVLSDDGQLTPLSMTVPIWFLPLDVTLVRVCGAGDPCGW